jgi:hypothetical protein
MGVSAPYPNPVSAPPVRVDLDTVCPRTVSWKVVTTNYRVVAKGSVMVEGRRSVAWDLRDLKGKAVANGYYHWVFMDDRATVIRKVMVLR